MASSLQVPAAGVAQHSHQLLPGPAAGLVVGGLLYRGVHSVVSEGPDDSHLA